MSTTQKMLTNTEICNGLFFAVGVTIVIAVVYTVITVLVNVYFSKTQKETHCVYP